MPNAGVCAGVLVVQIIKVTELFLVVTEGSFVVSGYHVRHGWNGNGNGNGNENRDLN